jgi:hypothetical protein
MIALGGPNNSNKSIENRHPPADPKRFEKYNWLIRLA